MADDNAVMYSFGQLEGWIEKVAQMAGASNVAATLTHLSIVEAAFKEYRLKCIALQKLAVEAKAKLDVAVNL